MPNKQIEVKLNSSNATTSYLLTGYLATDYLITGHTDGLRNGFYQQGQAQLRKNAQQGFTLLELMVAMAIFALLAVAGWQVFDGINRSKERAQVQVAALTDLQYGYQQLQRDMLQVVAYQRPDSLSAGSGNNGNGNSGNGSSNNGNNNGSNGLDANSGTKPGTTLSTHPASSAFSLQDNQLSFIRHADPDPRYRQNSSLERIVYTFHDGNLIRERYTSITSGNEERPLTSLVISGVSGGQFQVLLPEPSSVFPALATAATQGGGMAPQLEDSSVIATFTPTSVMLPKGVAVSFNLLLGSVDTPISWVYALAPAPPTPSSFGADNHKTAPKPSS